jgi:hypothetical protein
MNETCGTYSDPACYCFPSMGNFEENDDKETIAPMCLTYFSWIVFVSQLNGCLPYFKQNLEQRCHKRVINFLLTVFVYLSILAGWEAVVPLFTYRWQPPHNGYNRYHYMFNLSLFGLAFMFAEAVVFLKLWFADLPVLLKLWRRMILYTRRITRENLLYFIFFIKKLLEIGLILTIIVSMCSVGVTQLLINLPIQVRHTATAERARRIISPEYTMYIWICFFLSILITWAFTKGKKSKQSFFYTNKEINIMIRIFPYIWSSQFLHEFFCLFIDYENLNLVPVWNKLSVDENRHLVFNFLQLMTIWICTVIAIHQHYYMNVNPFSLTAAFISFHNIIYYHRFILINNNFTGKLPVIAEVIFGHIFILIGVWALLHYTAEQKTEDDNQTEETIATDQIPNSDLNN